MVKDIQWLRGEDLCNDPQKFTIQEIHQKIAESLSARMNGALFYETEEVRTKTKKKWEKRCFSTARLKGREKLLSGVQGNNAGGYGVTGDRGFKARGGMLAISSS